MFILKPVKIKFASEIFAESEGLLQKEREFFVAKFVISFNAKISRQG